MDLQNNVNELITLRTNGVEDAMKSMKDIESLFDEADARYRTIGTTALFLTSNWVVRCCIVRVTWRLYSKGAIIQLSVKRYRRSSLFRRIAPFKKKNKRKTDVLAIVRCIRLSSVCRDYRQSLID